MKNKGDMIMGSLWTIIAVALVVILVVALIRNSSKSSDDKGLLSGVVVDLLETKTYSPQDIQNFDIDLKSENIVFEKSTEEKIVLELYCTENTKPVVETQKNTLKISETNNILGVRFGVRKVLIKVPAACKLSDVDVKVSSGSVSISDIESANIDLNVSSGTVRILNSKSDKIDVNAKSGSVKIENCEADFLDCRTMSGSTKVDGSFGGMDLHGISGSINANLSKPLSKNSEMHTTSGSINVTLPSDSNMDIKYSLVSGNYRNEFTGTKGKKGKDTIGAGGVTLDISTTSGSVNVK